MYQKIFGYVDTHQDEFTEDELLSLAFLCSAIAQDRRMQQEEEENSS